MQVIKNNLILVLAVIFFVLFLLTRLPYLGHDAINPDGVNWYFRSEQFYVGIKTFDFAKTYQHYHPGVSLMWVVGFVIEAIKQIFPSEAVRNHVNFYLYHVSIKWALVFVQLVLSAFVAFILCRVLENYYRDSKEPVLRQCGIVAVLSVSLFSLEPFFIGNSRLLHMDVLFSLFVFLSLLFAFYSVELSRKLLNVSQVEIKTGKEVKNPLYKKQLKGLLFSLFLSGLFSALSFLTKSIGIGVLFFISAYMAAHSAYRLLNSGIFSCAISLRSYSKAEYRKFLYAMSPVIGYLVVSVFFIFILFPAMWVEPIHTLSEIFTEAERVGGRKGHEQIFFGMETTNPGFLFYPLIILLKISPFTLLGVFLYKINLIKTFLKEKSHSKISFGMLRSGLFAFCNFLFSEKALILYLSIFYLGYFIVMSFLSKKIDRYMLPLYPYLALLAVLGYAKLLVSLKNNFLQLGRLVLGAFLTFFIFWPMYYYSPYYFTYTSPLFGSAQSAEQVIAQKPFGIAVPELKELIISRYASYYVDSRSDSDAYPKIGMLDIKPMSMIYPNSRLRDIRVSGAGSYDLIILASDEDLPEETIQSAKRSGFYFEKDSSLYVNGLEYWRVYVKKY